MGQRVRGRIRSALVGLTVSSASVVALFIVGETVCRVFFPDTRLRYASDPDALYRLAANQVATIELASGLLGPPARINGLGLRGGDPDTSRPSILVLGDSFTFGSGVADDETFSARLEQRLGGAVNVVNGGHPGYGIFQMAAALRRLGDALRPRLVVVVVWQGDLLRQPPDAFERERFLGRQRLSAMVKSSVLATHVYRRLERFLTSAGQDSLVFRVGEGGNRGEASAKVVRESHLRGLRADAPRLLAMHEEARRYGRGLLLVLWPKEDYAAGLPDAERGLAEALTAEFEALARQPDLPFISIQTAMRPIVPKGRLLLPNDWHPTPLAHCLVAEQIAEKLRDLDFTVSRVASCDAN